jgi:hypothetical protein
MSKGRRVAVETIDPDDLLLSIEGFEDDLLSNILTPDENDSLEVDGLHTMLPARKAAAEAFRAIDHSALDAGRASDYFSGGVKVRQVETTDDDLFFLSDTRRAALEFERFAEEFHAFARECLRR